MRLGKLPDATPTYICSTVAGIIPGYFLPSSLQMPTAETVLARLVSVAQYAMDKKVSRQTVYNWIATGQVKSQKIGKSLFVVRP